MWRKWKVELTINICVFVEVMEKIIYQFIEEHMMTHVILIAVAAAAMLGAMAVDFAFGLIKAKQRGEARTSTGYKKTAAKAQKYFSPFMALVFIDLICCVVIKYPVFSMLWAAYCVLCEFKSVREKSWQKEELRKAERTVNVILENKDEIAKVLTKVLFEQNNKEEKP